MASIQIQISDHDLSLLRRIAKSIDRRLPDLVQIVFADGLLYTFGDESLCFKKEQDELTQEEKDQIAINKSLEENGYYSLSDEKRAETAYKEVKKYWQNFGPTETASRGFDNLIKPMIEEIKSIALN